MATTLVCVFADRSAARSATDRLVEDGLSALRIKLHDHTPTARNAALILADELATGGFISNLMALMERAREHHVADDKAATYADVVRTEGTLLSVEASDELEARRCVKLLRSAGALHVTTLPETETVSFHRLYPQLPAGGVSEDGDYARSPVPEKGDRRADLRQ